MLQQPQVAKGGKQLAAGQSTLSSELLFTIWAEDEEEEPLWAKYSFPGSAFAPASDAISSTQLKYKQGTNRIMNTITNTFSNYTKW